MAPSAAVSRCSAASSAPTGHTRLTARAETCRPAGPAQQSAATGHWLQLAACPHIGSRQLAPHAERGDCFACAWPGSRQCEAAGRAAGADLGVPPTLLSPAESALCSAEPGHRNQVTRSCSGVGRGQDMDKRAECIFVVGARRERPLPMRALAGNAV
eukprot:352385-Chlamydomonas_euryale.AAC.5